MFLKLIFTRLHLRHNKYLMATVYGLFYCVFFFTAYFAATYFLKRLNLLSAIAYSLFIGVVMFFVYLIKTEAFKL